MEVSSLAGNTLLEIFLISAGAGLEFFDFMEGYFCSMEEDRVCQVI